MVDSGAYMLVIPEHVKMPFGLEQVEQREVELAEGETKPCDIVGPIEIRFANRRAVSNAFVSWHFIIKYAKFEVNYYQNCCLTLNARVVYFFIQPNRFGRFIRVG